MTNIYLNLKTKTSHPYPHRMGRNHAFKLFIVGRLTQTGHETIIYHPT